MFNRGEGPYAKLCYDRASHRGCCKQQGGWRTYRWLAGESTIEDVGGLAQSEAHDDGIEGGSF